MVQPTNRTLLIPGKNATGASYKRDMQTLEAWARQPIQQLIAGSGITLSPSSGLATDSKGNGPNPITISSSGGGSSLTYCVFELVTAGDPTFWANGFQLPTSPQDYSGLFFGGTNGTNTSQLFANSSGSSIFYTVGSSMVLKASGVNLAQLLLNCPFYSIDQAITAGQINVNLFMGAIDLLSQGNAATAQGGVWESLVYNYDNTNTPSGPVQPPDTDFTIFGAQQGTELSMTSVGGTPGIYLTGGGKSNWIGACWAVIEVTTGTTF